MVVMGGNYGKVKLSAREDRCMPTIVPDFF